MYSEFKFVDKVGLQYEDDIISEFEPYIEKCILYYDIDTTQTKHIYCIVVKRLDGSITEAVEVDSLSNLSYFKLFHCPDSLLGQQEKRLLKYKLQVESEQVEQEKIVLCRQGFYLYHQMPIFVLGDNVICKNGFSEKVKIVSGYKMRASSNMTAVFLNMDAKKYISMVPGVTEILFYASLLAMLKPILVNLGYVPDFITSIIGPSGHLKTTLVRKYALWLQDTEQQEISFQDGNRKLEIIERIDNLRGQNFLADDLHKIENSSGSARQSERLDTIVRHLSSNGKTANVFVTGESMEKMGIFSCRDRMLQIKIFKMNTVQLDGIKKKLKTFNESWMPMMALRFAKAIVENYVDVVEDIQRFWSTDGLEVEKKCEYPTRTFHHGLFIRLTEKLVKKYVFNNSIENSCEQELIVALNRNCEMQQQELAAFKRQEEDSDLVLDIYNMLGGKNKYLVAVSDRNQYIPNGESFLIDNGHIYIFKIALQQGMIKYLKRTVSWKALSDAMHNAGILEEDLDVRTKKKFGKRHYVISQKALDLYCKTKESENTF